MTDYKKNKFGNIVYPVVECINKIDSRLFIFVLLCLNLLSFVPGDNEETYFAIAKQYMDPSWIPNSFTFTEWVGTRFLFQNIAGFALKYLSFEQLTFWGRMLNFLCYAFPLALIFKELNIKNLGIFCILQLYIKNVNSQGFFGMEWIFGGFEGKTIAYIFVFFGLYFMLKSKFKQASLMAALASYFHILVGGWFFVLVWICGVVCEKNFKQALITGLVYIGAVLPFILYLALYLHENQTIINGVDVDWVYSFFRNTHHTAPMHRDHAMTKVLPRVIMSFALLLLGLFYFKKNTIKNISKLNTIATISLCMVFIGLAITFIDVNGRFLKYYLFRIAAIGAFTYYILLFLFFRDKMDKWFNPVMVRSVGLVLISVFFIFEATKNFMQNILPEKNKDLTELAVFVSETSQPDDVYLFLEEDELSFSRKTRRDAFVIFKFDPGGGEKIYEWYVRERLRRQLREDISILDTITSNRRLDYLITRNPMAYQHLKEIYHNKTYYLYGVTKSE